MQTWMPPASERMEQTLGRDLLIPAIFAVKTIASSPLAHACSTILVDSGPACLAGIESRTKQGLLEALWY